ncbi:MAG: O-antigen ligase family protein [Elusimicrobia bacterium]|nr:O-antigen ligase family protein [Elusimicrobiota bacterium]
MLDSRPTWTVRLLAFSLALGGLRDPRLFAAAGVAAWIAVRRERPTLGPATPWLPWLAWAALSTAFSVQPLAGLPVIARWAAVLACASLAASWSARQREEWLQSFFVVASGLAAAALATGAGRGWRDGMTGLIPPYYNYTSFVLSAAAAAAAAWLLHPRGTRSLDRKAVAAAGALALLCLVLARSRGAWLGLGAAAALWSARRWGPRALAAAVVAAALLGGALAGGLLPASVEEIVFKKYRIHAEARPRLWRAAAAVAADHPWLGTGPGGFAVGFRRRPVPFEDGAARWAMSTDYAHSELLQVAAETGWTGLALWLLGLGAALRGLFGRADEEPAREAAAAAAAAMTAQLATDNMLQIPALAALWLSALAMASARAGAWGRPWPHTAVLVGAVLALVSWMPKAIADSGPARAAAVFPAEPGPREDLAYEALAAGRTGAAEAHWAAAEDLEPFNAIHPWRRAQLAAAAGRWAQAERLAARATDLEPGFMAARLTRAEALVRLKRVPEARTELDHVLRMRARRGSIPRHSGYERVVVTLYRRDYDRVAALAGRPPLPR